MIDLKIILKNDQDEYLVRVLFNVRDIICFPNNLSNITLNA
jgi:hypothetical protein